MPDICVATTAATCVTHTQTGSSRVSIGGKGVSRVGTDTAAGLIIGPGSQSVFVEGDKVSLPGDAISTHPPCGVPGQSIHCAAMTIAGQARVVAGTGFAADTGDPGDAPSPNIEMDSFSVSLNQLFASGQGHYPPTNMQAAMEYCYTGDPPTPPAGPRPPTPTYSYTVKNSGNDTAQPFVVGFWRFLNGVNAPDQAILTVDSLEFYPDVELVAQQSVGSLAPGQTYSSTFQYPDLYLTSKIAYAFGIYADIYNTATEPDEKNSTSTLTISISNYCDDSPILG